jgi:hypothetical protein
MIAGCFKQNGLGRDHLFWGCGDCDRHEDLNIPPKPQAVPSLKNQQSLRSDLIAPLRFKWIAADAKLLLALLQIRPEQSDLSKTFFRRNLSTSL